MAAAPKAKLYDPSSEQLETLSTEQLMRLLEESDAKLRETRKKYQEASAAARGEKKVEGFHKLSSVEQARIRKAFDQFDTDHSGKIDSKEFSALATKLGHRMKEEELAETMKELDKNQDGTIDFDEFVDWWRGTGSHKLLGRLKRNLKDRLLSKEVEETRSKVELDAIRDTSKPLSFNSSVYIGKMTDPGTSISVIVQPSSDRDFEKTKLPEGIPMRQESEQLEQMGEVTFSLRQGTTQQKIDRVTALTEKYINKANKMGKPIKLALTSSADSIVLKFFLYTTGDLPLDGFKRQFEAKLGRLPQGSDFFQSIALRFSLEKSLSDELSLESRSSSVDIAKSALFKSHLRGSAMLPEIFQAMCQSEMSAPEGEHIMLSVIARLFSSAATTLNANSPHEIVECAARQLVEIAREDVKEAFDLEDEEVEDDVLVERLRKQWMGKMNIPVSCLYAMGLQSLPDGEFPDVLDKIAEVVEGVSKITTTGRLFSASVDLKGFDILRKFPWDGGNREELIEKAMEEIEQWAEAMM